MAQEKKENKPTEIVINGKAIDLNEYFVTLQKEKNPHLISKKYFKLEFLDYSEIGYLMSAILEVCRQALENDNGSNIANGLDYSRLLGLVNNLISHDELELLTNLHNEIPLQNE